MKGNKRLKSISLVTGLLATSVLMQTGCTETTEPAPEFRLPAGFSAEVVVSELPNARSMAWGADGNLFVGTRRGGKVYAVRAPLSGDPEVLVIAEGLKMPNGVAFRDGALYVAENQRILRYPGIESRLEDPPPPEVVGEELPYDSALHSWKYIAFGPDGRLYAPLGAPCNVCDEPEFGKLLSMRADGSDRQVVARGIRNTVGFDWHPQSGELWFTDNGRDMLGDDVPPCELNRVDRQGQHYGFPFCHGGDIPDPEFAALGQCSESVPPVQRLAPHSAPLAVHFYEGNQFPAEYRGQAFIAEHGSWNRSEEAGKTGYRVSLVRLEGGKAVGYEAFMEGFLDGDVVRGRPVDLLEAPDGSLLVSDDQAGAIYRVSYTGPQT